MKKQQPNVLIPLIVPDPVSPTGVKKHTPKNEGKESQATESVFWKGYVRGLSYMDKKAPRYLAGERIQCAQLERQFPPEIDIEDFAFSVVTEWELARDYLDGLSGGMGSLPDTPNLKTVFFNLGELFDWYEQYKSPPPPFRYPEPAYKYVPPPKEEICTHEELMDVWIKSALAKMK